MAVKTTTKVMGISGIVFAVGCLMIGLNLTNWIPHSMDIGLNILLSIVLGISGMIIGAVGGSFLIGAIYSILFPVKFKKDIEDMEDI